MAEKKKVETPAKKIDHLCDECERYFSIVTDKGGYKQTVGFCTVSNTKHDGDVKECTFFNRK